MKKKLEIFIKLNEMKSLWKHIEKLNSLSIIFLMIIVCEVGDDNSLFFISKKKIVLIYIFYDFLILLFIFFKIN